MAADCQERRSLGREKKQGVGVGARPEKVDGRTGAVFPCDILPGIGDARVTRMLGSGKATCETSRWAAERAPSVLPMVGLVLNCPIIEAAPVLTDFSWRTVTTPGRGGPSRVFVSKAKLSRISFLQQVPTLQPRPATTE